MYIQMIASMLLLLGLSACSGPLGPIPGGELSGSEQLSPDSWEFAVQVEQLQLETISSAGDARSVNTWSGVVDGRLYIPTSLVRGAENPAERQWVKNALRDDSVRVRIDGQIYRGRISRVADASLIERVKSALVQKYGTTPDERLDAAWIFEVRA